MSSPRTSVTPAMRIVLVAVGAVVLAGLALALWFSSPLATPTGSTSPDAQGSNTPPASAGPQPGASPTSGSEVTEPDPSAPPTDRIPPRPTSAPLVSEPLPAPASASGDLVEGFPANVMGPPSGADVIDSSISTEVTADGATMQVTLVGRTDAAPEEVQRYYRDMWAALGLTDRSPTGPASELQYADAFTALSLGFSPASGTGTVFMVHGAFRTN